MFVELFIALGSNTVASALCSVGAIWLIWRFWAFTLKPSLDSRLPREMPYIIPFLGHALAFFKYSDKVFVDTRKYLGNTREPFAVTVAGQTLYGITSPQDAHAVYRNVTNLTYDGIVKDILKSLGLGPIGMELLWCPRSDFDSGRSLSHEVQETFLQQLRPGEHFAELWTNAQRQIIECMSFGRIPQRAIIDQGQGWKKVDLYRWCQLCFFEVTNKAVYGRGLYEVEPRMSELTAAFDDNAWKILFRFPRFAAKEVYDAVDGLRSAITKYLDTLGDQHQDAIWAVYAARNKTARCNLANADFAIFIAMMNWGFNGNAYKLAFWVLAIILQDPETFESIRAETKEALSGSMDEFGSRLDQCTRLIAICQEALRIFTNSISIREVTSDFAVNGKLLRAGNKVMVTTRHMHTDERVWGGDINSFDTERFFKEKRFAQSSSFRPFGGGMARCGGQVFALKEVLAFITLAIHQFDISLPDGTPGSINRILSMPELTLPGVGMVPPLSNQVVEVMVREKGLCTE